MATIVAAAGGGAWTTGGTWVGGVAPTAADDAQLASTSGNVTVGTGAVCRSLDCTSYTGTLTHTSGVTLTIGDSTAGAGNAALTLVAGMTYTLGSATTSAISFVSTSATQQTITTGGKTLGNWTVNGLGSSYLLADACTTGSTATTTLTAGALNTGGQTCTWGAFAGSGTAVRSLTLGASAVTCAGAGGWSFATVTNLTFSAGTSTITVSGANTTVNLGTNLTYATLVVASSGGPTVTSSGGVGTGSIGNLTRTGTATKTDSTFIGTNIVVSGTFTIAGNSATNRVQVESNVVGTARSITVNGSVVASNADFADITAAGSASWNLSAATGGSGNCGGNTSITFTTAAPQTWQGTSGGNWSDVTKWTSRVPLPQDGVTISSAFSATQTVTMDMPRLGGDITWAGSTGAPAWAITATQSNIFGSLTLAAGMSVTGTGTALRLRGRGSKTLTCAGVSFPGGLTVDTGNGTYTLQDALTVTGALVVGSGSHKGGTLAAAGMAVTCSTLTVGNANGGSVLTLGASTVTLTSTAAGTILAATVASGNAITAGTSTIVIGAASASDRNIAAHGFTLGSVTHTVAGSTGRLIFGTAGATGTVTVATLTFSDASNARGLRVWAGTTLAVTGTFNVLGSAGKLVTVDTSTSGTRATIAKTGGYVTTDYLSVQDIAGTGAWYVGTHSTDAGNNTGITFSGPPAVVNAGSFLALL